MNDEITPYLQLHPVDSAAYSDRREPLESRIFRIFTRSKFRSAPLSKATVDFMHTHIQTQIKDDKPIILIYAMGGGKGINTTDFPRASWAEFLHLKFLVENLHPVGEIYPPGVEIKWSFDDYAAQIFNNYQLEWQEAYTETFDALLAYFNKATERAIHHVRIPTDTWYDFEKLRDRIVKDAKAKAEKGESKEILAQWSKRAQNNFYNKDGLEGEKLQQAIEFSTLMNMAWLDYDFEVRGEYFGSGIPIAHFTDFPDSLYIYTVPGCNTQFWKANGYLEEIQGLFKSRIATRDAWKEMEPKLEFIDNPLHVSLPSLGKLPILYSK